MSNNQYLERMRLDFLGAMQHIWPRGPHDWQQHADVVRVFTMGYIECAKRNCSAMITLEVIAALDTMLPKFSDIEWHPEKEWCW